MKQLSQLLLLARMTVWGLQGEEEDGEKLMESRSKGGFVSPEGVVLVMTQINLSGVQKTSLQTASPQKTPTQTPNNNPRGAGLQDFCMGSNSSKPKVMFPNRAGINPKYEPHLSPVCSETAKQRCWHIV